MKCCKKLVLTLLFLMANLYGSDILTVNIDSVKDGNVTLSVFNNTKSRIKLLKWNTMFENEISADIFNITCNDKKIPYIGKLIKRTKPSENDYIYFSSQETKSVNIDLSKYYKLNISGSCKVSYRGIFSATVIDKIFKKSINKTKPSLKNQKILSPSSNSVNFNFFSTKSYIRNAKVAANFYLCSSDVQQSINQAHDAAINLLNVAKNDLSVARHPTSALRYVWWFGSESLSRQFIASFNMRSIYSALNYKQVQFYCDCNESYFAYVEVNTPYIIHLCNSFYSAPTTGEDSKAGTIIHETSHFNMVAGTDDHAYGHEGAHNLGLTSPSKAIDNADNYEYFAENTPYLTMSDEENVLSLNGSTSDTLAVNERKMYSIKLSEPLSILNVWTSGESDTIGTMYTSQTKFVEANDDIGSDINFKIVQLVGDDISYFQVKDYNGSEASYNIHASREEPSYESIDFQNPVSLTKNYIISSSSLYNMVKLQVKKKGNFHIYTTSNMDIEGYLYDKDINLLGKYSDIDYFNNNANFQFSKTLDVGDYYLFIDTYKTNNYAYYGNYSLHMDFTPISLAPVIMYLLD